MSFKEFSTARTTPTKPKPVARPADAPGGDRPATQPDRKAAEVAPASKP